METSNLPGSKPINSILNLPEKFAAGLYWRRVHYLDRAVLNCWALVPLIRGGEGGGGGGLPVTVTDKQRDQRAANVSLVAPQAQDNELQQIFW